MKMEMQGGTFSTYFRDSVFLLQSAIQHYRAGEKAFYRIAALQMRLLLCDAVRRHNQVEDISLLPKIQPRCVLPPVSPDGRPDLGRSLPLADWLSQPLSGLEGKQMSIRDFIRRVCDQDGGAHVDPKPKAGLENFPNRAELIILLAEQVCNGLR